MIFTWCFAGLWNLIAWPMVLLSGSDAWAQGEALFAWLFPFVGIGLVWYAVRKGKQWRRYGITRLTLDPYPGAIGGHVGGVIELGVSAGAQHNYEVTLECVYSYMSGSGKNRSRSYDVKWQAQGPAAVAPNGRDLRLEFRFDVPHGLPQSEKKRGTYHFWRVLLKGDQPDVPVDRSFDIGVFATAETSRHIGVDSTAAGRESAAQEISGALTDSRIAAALRDEIGLSIEQRGDWLRLMFLAGRQKLLAAIVGCVGLSFLAVGVFSPEAGYLTGWIFTILGIVGLGIGLYLPFNTLDVHISPTEFKRVRAWFGFVIRRQSVRPQQLRKLEIAKGASTTVNDRTTVYYHLVAKGSFGKFRLVDGLADRGLVEAIRDQVMIHAGLEQT